MHAAPIATTAAAESSAVSHVACTTTEAPGTDAEIVAIASNAASNGWTACAQNLALASSGASTSARNSIGCAIPITGDATRFASGAMMLIRPNVYATSGAVTAHAIRETMSSLVT